MYAVILKSDDKYELQIKKEIESSTVSHRERFHNADVLKRSITVDWMDYSGDNENIMCVARIV